MIRTLFAEGLVKPGRLASFSDGIEALGAASRPFDPERVAQSCGIPASEISSLAREFAASPAAVCYGRLGACQQEFGATSAWLINALNAITGNLDRAGGSLFPKPAVDIVTVGSLLNQKGSFARWRTRVRGLPEFGGQFPSAALAEEIETPGDGRVRALIVSAGNPALSAPNGARLAKALPRLDFMVAMDFYHNETTAHADVILPPVCALERDHFDVVFRAFGVRNTARYTTPLIDPPPDSLEEWQIYCRLGQRIAAHHGGARGLIDRLRMRVLERITPRRVLSLLLRLGPYGLRLSDLRTEEHTRDLGPLKPCLPRRLATPRKRIQLAPAIFQADITRLAEKLAAPGDPGELVLIGRRQLRSNNSWMHRFSRLEAHDNRCTLLMHPGDAAVRGLRDCDIVEIRGRAGATTVQLEISSSVMPGVVSLPHGFSHASLNDVTDDLRLDNMSGTAAFSGTPVSVAAVNRSSIEDRQFERREHAGIS
jgi:anaerobic selenocysteine-containing dehydrogenase